MAADSQNTAVRWTVAVFKEISTYETVKRHGELFRLVVPIAVRRSPSGITVLEAEVQCVCGDIEFCKKLERVAEQLWKAGGRRLSPQDVAAALSRWSP